MAKKMKQHLHTCGIEGEVMFESAITKHVSYVLHIHHCYGFMIRIT